MGNLPPDERNGKKSTGGAQNVCVFVFVCVCVCVLLGRCKGVCQFKCGVGEREKGLPWCIKILNSKRFSVTARTSVGFGQRSL